MLSPPDVRVLLLDIEGTTTPIEFVFGTLFPYARAHVRALLERHGQELEVRSDVARLHAEHAEELARGEAPPPWGDAPAAVTAFVHWLMDKDRKTIGLKALQGKIWKAGYASGALRGQVYDDVPRALERWRSQGRRNAIFSSGSVLAQRLLFSSTPAGDLTRLIDAYFDTTAGPKQTAASYGRIAHLIGCGVARILFLSDVQAELDAAAEAGLHTGLCVRGGRAVAGSHPVITGFDQVLP